MKGGRIEIPPCCRLAHHQSAAALLPVAAGDELPELSRARAVVGAPFADADLQREYLPPRRDRLSRFSRKPPSEDSEPVESRRGRFEGAFFSLAGERLFLLRSFRLLDLCKDLSLDRLSLDL